MASDRGGTRAGRGHVTDPPLKLLKRFIPDLRLGGVALDLSFTVLFLVVWVMIMIVGG
jgi:YggT family protein